MPGNLYRRGRTWWGRVTAEGREHRRSLGTGDRAEAQRRLSLWLAEVGRIRYDAGRRVTYAMAVERWVAEVVPELKPITADRYLCSSARLFAAFGDLPLDRVDKAAIKEFVRVRKAAGVTTATVRRDLTALASIMDSAEEEGWVEVNPVRLINTRKLKERREPIDPPSEEAVATVLRHASPGMAALVRFCAAMGCRQEEAAALRFRDLDLDRRTVTFVKAKRDRIRTVRLTSPGGDALPVVLPLGTKVGTAGTVRALPSAPIFGPRPGERFKNVSSNFRSLCLRVEKAEAEAGRAFRPFRFHDLRHAFCLRWLRAGGDVYALKEHVGHARVATTELYLPFVGAVAGREGADSPRHNLGTDGDGSGAVEKGPRRG